MANAAGTLETLVRELGTALKPLKDLLKPEFFVQLGIELPREISGDATLTAKLSAAGSKAGELESKIANLASAIAADNAGAIVAAAAPLIVNVAELATALTAAGTALHQAANGLPDAAKYQSFASALATHAFEYMLIGYLNDKAPSLTGGLSMIGLIDREFDPSPELELSRTAKTVVPRRIYLNRFTKLLSHPDQYFQDTFKWGANDFDGGDLLLKAQGFLESLGVPAAIYQNPGSPPSLEAFVFTVSADKTVSPPGLKAEISLPGAKTVDQTVNFSDLWKGSVNVTANYAAGLEVTASPPFTIRARPPSGRVDLSVLLGLKADKGAGDPIVILGVTGGTQLQAKSIGASVGFDAQLDATGGAVAPAVQVKIEEGKLVLDFSKSDGFVQTLTSGAHVEAAFGLTANWNPTDGLRLEGHGGVEMFIPLHLDLSVLIVNGVYISIGFTEQVPLQIGLATQLTANLGPLVAVVDRIGIRSDITLPDSGGNLGLANIDFAFQPPRGVGLSLDTGVIKGGGFLYLDPDRGEYFGALELSFEGIITLKAIG